MSSEAQRENVSSLTVTEPLSVHINLHKSSVCAHVDGLQTLNGSRTAFPRSPLRELQSATAAPRHITMLSGVDGGGGSGVCVCFYGNGQGSSLTVRWVCVCVCGMAAVCAQQPHQQHLSRRRLVCCRHKTGLLPVFWPVCAFVRACVLVRMHGSN